MCGIAGVMALGRQFVDLKNATNQMASAILHRGPDDGDVWVDGEIGVALAHRRLSILDLSPAGHQPMHSACGRYVIVFNGEIYNHLALRDDLARSGGGIQWRSHSDTETLLGCISIWGIERTLKASVGMFAFALWDRQERALVLARDRMGEKPLYYGILNGQFAFASELKAIDALPGARLEVDRDALGLLMRHSYVPDPYCIYKGLKKLPPGTWLKLNPEALGRGDISEPRAYWSAIGVAKSGTRQPLVFANDLEATASLDQRLRESVRLQMVADVPLGAFLSGGVDSSTIVALMQAQSDRPVKTFSIGFSEDGYNEAHHAKAVARHLGTDHTELYVTAEDALAVIPNLPTIYDEPLSDASQIPTYLVSKMARQHVTVSLSGDGGDELFGGYTRYFLAARLWSVLEKIPLPVRQAAAAMIRTLSPGQWDALYKNLSWLLPARYKANLPGDRLHKGAGVIGGGSGSDLYLGLVSHWDPSGLVRGGLEPTTPLREAWPDLPSLTEQMMALDAITYLSGDILTKVDRAAMTVSLETRVPLLDHRVFEFAWSLPMHYKVRNGEGKWLLKQVLYQYVPKNLIERPKMGFGVPIDTWLRGPLRDWAEALLDPIRLRREGYLEPEPIRQKWNEHLAGRRNWQYPLWDVLMFQAWLENKR